MLTVIKKKKNISRILVIQTAKIGDLICSTPVFREIKKKYPDAHLTVMVNPITKELLEHNPRVNEVITLKGTDYKGFSGKVKLSNLIRKGRYDIAICLNPNVPCALATFLGLVPVRISVMPNFSGVTFKLASGFYTHLEKHISGRLVLETYMQMLKAIGIESNDISKEVYKSENADKKAQQILREINKSTIGLAVSSGNKLKELGTEKIAMLANMLLESMDIYLVFIGSRQDRNTADAVLNLIGKKDRIIAAAGKFSLKELPALIERLTLFIGVDTGITYMADALSIPVIDIAGPSNMEDQRPTGNNVIIIQKQLPCVPCSHAFNSPYYCRTNTRKCIEMIKAEDILNAAEKLVTR